MAHDVSGRNQFKNAICPPTSTDMGNIHIDYSATRAESYRRQDTFPIARVPTRASHENSGHAHAAGGYGASRDATSLELPGTIT
jgi:hypothetical protein